MEPVVVRERFATRCMVTPPLPSSTRISAAASRMASTLRCPRSWRGARACCGRASAEGLAGALPGRLAGVLLRGEGLLIPAGTVLAGWVVTGFAKKVPVTGAGEQVYRCL